MEEVEEETIPKLDDKVIEQKMSTLSEKHKKSVIKQKRDPELDRIEKHLHEECNEKDKETAKLEEAVPMTRK